MRKTVVIAGIALTALLGSGSGIALASSAKTPTANPGNTQATVIPLGTFNCLQADLTVSVTGSNTAGTSAWYEIEVAGAGACYNASVRLTGRTGDTFTVWNGPPPAYPKIASAAVSATGLTFGDNNNEGTWVQVTGGKAGKPFTLVINTGPV